MDSLLCLQLQQKFVSEHIKLIQQLEKEYLDHFCGLMKQKALIHEQIQRKFYQKLFEVPWNLAQNGNTANIECPTSKSIISENVESKQRNNVNMDNKQKAINPESERMDIDNSVTTHCDICNKCCLSLNDFAVHIQSHSMDNLKEFASKTKQEKNKMEYLELVKEHDANLKNGIHPNDVGVVDISLPDDNKLNENANNINDLRPEPLKPIIPKRPISTNKAIKFISDDDKKQADILKLEGNELLKHKQFKQAMDKYSKAIQLNPMNAVYFSNRAAVHQKLKNYEQVAADSYVYIFYII